MTPMSRKQQEQPWSYKAGRRGSSVIVYERRGVGGVVYAKTWSQPDGRYLKESLGYRLRDEAGELVPERLDEAEAYALKQSAKLLQGAEALRQGQVTLDQVIRAYLEYRTSRKSLREQRVDKRLAELWKRFLGSSKEPHRLSLREWERFIDQRVTGEIDGRANRVPDPKKQRPVRPGTVGGDLDWLGGVFRWATLWRLPNGTYLMRENPVRGYETPMSANPRRPVASQNRFEAIRARADEHTMEIRWNGKRTPVRSYLGELLDIANGTGRRISAICVLRYDDLNLGRTEHAPHGSITWPADTDKMGYEKTVPIDPTVRAALDRVLTERPGIGAAPLFPTPGDNTSPLTRHLADKWLREGEKLAGVEPQKGSLWHAYRRKWATERKHLPVQDVARAGGWKSNVVVQNIYTQADDETMLQVVLDHGQLREAR